MSPTPAKAQRTRLTLPGASPATPADVPGRRKEPREPQALPVFRRLAALVPPGSWPAVLPLTLDGFRRPRPLALGIHDRLAALLPEAEHRALRKALAAYAGRPAYLAALAAEGARRWSDDGTVPAAEVGEEERAVAARRLEEVRAAWRATPAPAEDTLA